MSPRAGLPSKSSGFIFLSVSFHSPPPSVRSPWIQATEWFHDLVQSEEGEVQKGWLLLEEEERREDHPGGSHEAQSPGSRGECARFGYFGDRTGNWVG